MINANELRIGNWLNFTNPENGKCGNAPVKAITIKNIYENEEHHLVKNNIEPIPLTPEILEKAGFIKVGEEYQGTDPAPFHLFRCKYHSRVKMMYVKSHSPFGKLPWFHVEYVHQLQNICFALTGEELEIKL